jgi:hypothetical protein
MEKLSLCLTNQALRHVDAWGSGCIEPHFLDLSTSWEWSASRPDRLTPEERAPCTHRVGGCVGPRASLDDMAKGKFFTPPGFEI